MIKLIATDLDGTLFYPKKRLTLMSKDNKNFLAKFINNGGKVVLVSGRNTAVVHKVEKKIGHSVAFLGCNGSYLIEDGEMKMNHPLPNDIMMELYTRLKSNFGIMAWFLFDETKKLYITLHGVSGLYQTFARLYNVSLGVYKEKVVFGEKSFLKHLSTQRTYKLMPIFGVGKNAKLKAKQAFTAINDLYKDKITVCCTDNSLEFTALGSNKASGLEEYISMLGITKDEVAVIGDSGNDVVLFDNFPNTFCMAHGEEHIKSHAKTVVNRVYDLDKYVFEE